MVRALDGKGKVITRPSLRSVLSDAKDALFSLFSSPREAINGSANCIGTFHPARFLWTIIVLMRLHHLLLAHLDNFFYVLFSSIILHW